MVGFFADFYYLREIAVLSNPNHSDSHFFFHLSTQSPGEILSPNIIKDDNRGIFIATAQSYDDVYKNILDLKGNDKNVEGNHKIIPYKGKIKRIIHDIRDGVHSSFSYVGANNMSEYHSKVEFVEVTRAGQIEALPHLLN